MTKAPKTSPTLQKELVSLFSNLADFIAERDAHYKSSWKQRGGQGAFYTIARPWDRFVAIAARQNFDLFTTFRLEINAGKTANDDGTLQACCRDLLAYMALLLVEASLMRQVYRNQDTAETISPIEEPAPTKLELLQTLIKWSEQHNGKGIELGQLRDWVELIIEILKAPK